MKSLIYTLLFSLNVNATELSELNKHIEQYAVEVEQGKIKGVTSFIVLKANKLLQESYAPTTKRNDLHELRSVTKSITALLIGQAIQEDLLPDVESFSRPFLQKINRPYSLILTLNFNEFIKV